MGKYTTVKIAGPAGFGIKTSGQLLSEILLAHGQQLIDYSEYPSLVRGGHNTYQVTFSSRQVFSVFQQVDIFFSISPGHYQSHLSEFNSSSVIFYDEDKPVKSSKSTYISLPLRKLSEAIGSQNFRNTICLGVACFCLNLDPEIAKKIISHKFALTEKENLAAFDIGYGFAQQNCSNSRLIHESYIINHKSVLKLYDGNEAYGWGFLAAGGNFFAAYPMTPASGALHFLAQKQQSHHIQVHHPEDEIAAASMVAGAAFAGARVATGTSGGGFALMTETVSFAGVANLPIVFYLVSRPGPATGLPTWTAQGDLLFAVNSGHGEFPIIVLAPGSQQETFEFSALSLNLAAKFNLPVIVISDKTVGESGASIADLSGKKVKQIISSKPIPGTPSHEYLANSYEHDDQGYSIEDSATVKKMVEKRLALIPKILKTLPKANFYGTPDAKKLIVTWGSPVGAILQALEGQTDYAVLQIRSVWPIDPDIKKFFAFTKDITVIENNATSQLTSLLKSQFDFNPSKIILKYDGRPFFPEEIRQQLGINHKS